MDVVVAGVAGVVGCGVVSICVVAVESVGLEVDGEERTALGVSACQA